MRWETVANQSLAATQWLFHDLRHFVPEPRAHVVARADQSSFDKILTQSVTAGDSFARRSVDEDEQVGLDDLREAQRGLEERGDNRRLHARQLIQDAVAQGM